MITDFEKFKLEVGDYVIWKPAQWLPDRTRSLVENKIGKIVEIRKDLDEVDIYYGGDIGTLVGVSIDKIEYWSKDKKDCETYLAAKKYNI